MATSIPRNSIKDDGLSADGIAKPAVIKVAGVSRFPESSRPPAADPGPIARAAAGDAGAWAALVHRSSARRHALRRLYVARPGGGRRCGAGYVCAIAP